MKKKNNQSDQDQASYSKNFNKSKKAYVVDEKKNKEEPKRYYQEDENKKVNYYYIDIFIKDKDIVNDNSTVIITILSSIFSFYCHLCRKIFDSNNKLYKHLQNKCKQYVFKV